MKRVVLAILALLLLCGCETVHSELAHDFYAPPPVSTARLPLRFKIVADQPVRALTHSSGINYEITYGPALITALERQLEGVFESVTTVEEASPVQDTGMVYGILTFRVDPLPYAPSIEYKIAIAVKDGRLADRIGSYTYSGKEDYELTGPAAKSARATLGVTVPVLLMIEGDAHRQAVEGALQRLIATSVREMAEAVSGDPNLRQFALGTPPPRAAAKAVSASEPTPRRFAEYPRVTRFPKAAVRPDDVAVVIGNADYGRQAKDIPDVLPAHADAEGMRLYATQALGIREGNVIFLKDATGAQMARVFGTRDEPRGQLYDWVKSSRSRVFVYYSGHGAPGGGQGGTPYLVPVDADASRIEINGYPLKQLYDNLGTLPAENVTVVVEACFSGISQGGNVLEKASPVYFDVVPPPVPAKLTVITAGAMHQVASWEPDDSHGLFTRHFLEGMSGKADADKDGKVGLDELERYLRDTLTYQARRHYGRDQQAQILRGDAR